MITVRLGPSVTVGDLTIRPVERTTVNATPAGRGVIAVASKEAVAVIVRSPGGTFALDISGEPMALDDLIRDVPEVAEWLG